MTTMLQRQLQHEGRIHLNFKEDRTPHLPKLDPRCAAMHQGRLHCLPAQTGQQL